MIKTFAMLFVFVGSLLMANGSGEKPDFDAVMAAANYKEGILGYQSYLQVAGSDAQARAELGLLQTIRAVEFLAQGFLEHASPTVLAFLPPGWEVEGNKWTYDGMENFLMDFIAKLDEASETLRMARGEILIPFRVNRILIDFTGDGKIQPMEQLEALFDEYNTSEEYTTDDFSQFVLHLDQADIIWLEGYVAMLRGLFELALVWSWEPLFYQYGPFIFNVDYTGSDSGFYENESQIKIGVRNQSLGEKARQSFLTTAWSGLNLWDEVLRETDDDREWISSPTQRSPFQDFGSTPELIDVWQATLTKLQDVLEGDLLLEFEGGLGFNVKRFLQSPPSFTIGDLDSPEFLFPYMEEGALVSEEDVFGAMDAFGDDAWLFALWAN